MIVAETLRRNRKITSTTSASVSTSVNVHVVHRRLDRRRAVVRARATFTGGRDLRPKLRQRVLDASSATATVLVPGCRWMARTIARSPLYQLAVLLFCTSSVTWPRSPRRTGAPLR